MDVSWRLPIGVSLVAILLVGCERSSNDGGEKISPPSPQLVVASANKTDRGQANSIRYEDGFITIDIRNTSLKELLPRVAKLAHFRLENYQADAELFDVSLTRVPVEEALRTILGETPYKLGYDNTTPGPVRKIVYLRVGVPDANTDADLALMANEKANLLKKGRRISDGELEKHLTREQLDALTEPERIQKLSHLAPSQENLPLLLDVLRHDKNPEMKIAAMASLENSAEPEAIEALQGSLNESDTSVVLAAIDSIEFAGDSSQIADLAKLLQHPNQEVRVAAAEAIEFLR